MFRSLKIGSILAASTAALALGIAAPASADGVSALADPGTAYSAINQGGSSQPLASSQTCATISLTGGALSGRSDSTSTFLFYSSNNCDPTTLVAVVPVASAVVYDVPLPLEPLPPT